MKKLIQTIAIILLPWFCSYAELAGTVTDSLTKEKVQGAIVTVENSFLVAVTDAQGKFSFPKMENKKVKIIVSRLGYEFLSKEISLPDEKVEVALQPKSYLTEEVVVTATRASENSPTAFTNISGEEIQKQNLGKDIPYLLNTTPSVVVTSDAGTGIGYSGIRVRGSDATRVNVTINGIPVNDAESHQVYWVDLPDFASSTDNIQIQRGIGASTNGAGAFGASVNIQSTTLSPEPFAAVNSTYGSFNTWKNTVTFGTGLMKDKFAFDGRLSKITSDGYIDRAFADLKSFYLSGGYYGNKSTLRAVIFSGKERTYQAWYGVPEDSLKTNRRYNPAGEYYDNDGVAHYYANQTDNYQQDYYQLLYSYAVTSKINLNAALHYTKGKGYYEEYQPQQPFNTYNLTTPVIGNDTIPATNLIRQLWLDNDFYGFTYSANYESNKLLLTFGGAGNRYAGRHYDQVIWAQYYSNGAYPWVYDDNNATKDDYNTYLKAIYSSTPSMHFYGDLQYRTISYSFRGFDADLIQLQQRVNYNFFNPKAGITYDLNARSKVYASVAVGHKEPMRDDFVDLSPLRPKPEQMMDVEAGYKFGGRKIRVGANVYFMNYKDQLILTGKLNDVGAYIRENVDKSYREGIELEFAWNIIKSLSLSANATFSSNKINTFNEYLYDYSTGDTIVNAHHNTDISFSPSLISAAIVSWSPIKNFSFEFVSKYVGKQYLDNTSNNTRKIDPYNVSDIRFIYTIQTSKMKALELKFTIYNLFDKKYESNGATYAYYDNGVLYNSNYYYPQAGINFMGGVNLKF